jgi:hypothetical protein
VSAPLIRRNFYKQDIHAVLLHMCGAWQTVHVLAVIILLRPDKKLGLDIFSDQT